MKGNLDQFYIQAVRKQTSQQMGLFSERMVHKTGDSNRQQTHIGKHFNLTNHKNAN